MNDGSDATQQSNRSFIGFYTDPELKEQAAQQAEEEGVSLSEWMRRRLREAGTNRRDVAAA